LDTAENPALNCEVGSQQTADTPPLSAVRKMDHSLLRSVAWNTISDWTGQIFSWAAFLLVLRFVGPADFGIVAMTVVLMPLTYTTTFGIGRAVVAVRDLTEDQIAQLNTVGLLLGLGSFAMAAVLAQPIAWFFKAPRLAPIIVVSATGFIINGAQLVSNGIMMKKMRFGPLSLLNAVASVTGAAVQLMLAWTGWGYWALVSGPLVLTFVRGVPVLWLQPQPYAIPRWASVKRPLAYGGHVVIALLAADVYESLDNLTAGRVLGSAALGLYGIAWTLAHVPVEKVTTMVTTVVSSYFVAVRDDLGAVRRYLRNLTQCIALLTFPACVGLGLVARELILLVLGPKWEGATGPLQALSAAAAFRSIVALLPKVLWSFGDARFVMWNSLGMLLVLGPAFYIGSHWGITGIALGWIFAYPWVVLFAYREVFAKIEMGAAEYFGSLRPALEGTLFMALAVEGVGYSISTYHSLLVRLVVKIAVGVVCYTGILLLRHRQRVLAFIELARSFRQNRA
jgi:PST family polysaccharide transporter